MDTVSNDWALFVQDDLKLSSQLTLFLGLRYEVVGVVRRQERHLRQLRPRRRRTPRRAQRADRRSCCRRAPSDAGPDHARRRGRRRPGLMQHRPEQLQPARGLRLPHRQRQQDGPAWRFRHLPPDRRRAGRARHHVAQPVPLRASRATGPTLQHGFTTGTVEHVARASATRGSTSTSRARTSTSTTSRSSASCRATSGCASATSARR